MTCAAGCAGRIPLPAAAQGMDNRAVIERVRANRCACQSYSAEVRLRYFSDKGRYKSVAQVFARRPDHLRYDIQSPHGGVLLAFATDGQHLAALDLGTNRLTEGAATPEHFDALLPLAPLGLGADGWVGLMFGEFFVDDAATLTYDESVGLFQLHWAHGAYEIHLGVDPVTFDVRQAIGLLNNQQAWRVVMGARDSRGLPTTLRLTTAADGTDLELQWRDVDDRAGLVDAMFVLPRPKGARVRDLDAVVETRQP